MRGAPSGPGRELAGLLADGRRDEARRALAEAREAGEPPPDPAGLGGGRIGSVPRGEGGEGDEEPARDALTAWRLPPELGGGALFVSRGERPPRATLVDPEDTLVLSFGGIGAAVGTVPLDLYRRSPSGEVEVVAARTFDVGPGSAGDPAEGPTPEEVLEETEELLDAVREETGCGWIPFGELEREEWERARFLEIYNGLAEEHGAEPMDGPAVDRENLWIRYVHSVRHDTLESFARAVFRGRASPPAGEDALAEAADRLAEAVREETGIGLHGLTVETDGPRFVARLEGRELGAWPCTREDWTEVLEAAREEAGTGAEGSDASGGGVPRAVPGGAARLAEALGLQVAEELFLALRDGLEERLAEAERERLAALVEGEVGERVRAALADLLPEGAGLSAEVVELPRSYRHGDPEDVQERGLPPFGVEVRCWDPDAGATVAIETEPPDPGRLAREAAERLREALADAGAAGGGDADDG